ncbi:MAG: hypothetical protein ACI9TV_001938 [Sulfurimonas sp.]|jgi:hypothetical protein|uniref:hypothetical protein n=1 Tax=Sulfurimonas sp. TaxID=2022749 RepID=UPI0039E6AB07
MNVTSTTQTQYTTTTSTNKRDDASATAYSEVAQKKQPTRYEVLQDMKYENMSEAERKERFHYFAMRSMPFLDEEGNKEFNKSLEGKTDIEKSQIKSVLQLSFMTSVKANHTNHTVDRQKFDTIDTSKDSTVSRFKDYISEFKKNGSIDNIGLIDVMNNFLQTYKANVQSTDIKNQEDSVVDEFMEDLYSKETINFKSEIIKDDIENKVNKYASLMLEERGDVTMSELETSKLLNQYKNELLQEYKDSLENSNENITNAKEITRFSNATVYEGLESGKTIEEARISARSLTVEFMNVDNELADASAKRFVETLIKAGRADSNALDLLLYEDKEENVGRMNNINFDDPFNSTMDLRQYGIEGSWEFYEVFGSQKSMINEIEKKINQFNFMLNNESKIEATYMKLEADAQTLGNNEGYKQIINDKYMPKMEAALNIFKNYKIYD